MKVLRGFTLLLLLQALGSGLSLLLPLPIPGPVFGLFLLWPVLQFTSARDSIGAAAHALLNHLSLLFIPAGVGVVTHLDLVEHYGVKLLIVIVVSTWIGLAVTALLLRALLSQGPEIEHKHG